VAMSKLVQVILAERERFEHLIRAKRKNYLEFNGGDSGIRTPDLRIMMKIASVIINKINGLRGSNPTV
jgi:hypothetical protein